jgi:hypothetical protein
VVMMFLSLIFSFLYCAELDQVESVWFAVRRRNASGKDISMFFFLFFLSRYKDTRVIGVFFYKARMHYSRRKTQILYA